MPPLGPFIGKNFGTSISPWMVKPDALEPFKASPPTHPQPVQHHLKPAPLSTYDIQMSVEIINASNTNTNTHTVTCESQLGTRSVRLRHRCHPRRALSPDVPEAITGWHFPLLALRVASWCAP